MSHKHTSISVCLWQSRWSVSLLPACSHPRPCPGSWVYSPPNPDPLPWCHLPSILSAPGHSPKEAGTFKRVDWGPGRVWGLGGLPSFPLHPSLAGGQGALTPWGPRCSALTAPPSAGLCRPPRASPAGGKEGAGAAPSPWHPAHLCGRARAPRAPPPQTLPGPRTLQSAGDARRSSGGHTPTSVPTLYVARAQLAPHSPPR